METKISHLIETGFNIIRPNILEGKCLQNRELDKIHQHPTGRFKYFRNFLIKPHEKHLAKTNTII
jgi:hypothetical protein